MLSGSYRNAVCAVLSLALSGALIPAGARPHRAPAIDASILGIPSGPQTLADRHQKNLSFLQQTIAPFFARLQAGSIGTRPEYAMDLSEAILAIDVAHARDPNPLFEHEPLLLALPSYSQVTLIVPESALARIQARLQQLGLGQRVRAVAAHGTSRLNFSNGLTQWVRDTMLVATEHGAPLLLPSLAYESHADLVHNDLGYLTDIDGKRHHYLRLPLFVQGGNLAVARAGHKLLLLGSEEIAINQQWFSESFGFRPSAAAVPEILKKMAGAQQALILPNSPNLFHLDMFVAPLADGSIGLLAPLDPERLAPADREVLQRSKELLRRAGFRIVPIPTSAERIGRFESPTNIVSFTDRRSGRHRALVPQFPEPAGNGTVQSLNAQALDAYRRAGIEPIAVEDRFHQWHGGLHCALLALR